MSGRNGHQRSIDELRRQAAERRAAVRRTAAALEDRLREGSHAVGEAIERTREGARTVDDFVHEFRWVLAGGALALGIAAGFRRKRRIAGAAPGQKVVYVERSGRADQKSILRSALGTAAAFALRQGVQYVMDRARDDGEADDDDLRAPHFPPGRPYTE